MADRNLCGFTLGEFTLREQIGEGVYRGEQELLRREVIVKVLHQRHDDDAPQGFLREAQLDHPYAAHVYARGAKGEDGWIASELVQGVMLQHWLQKHGPMPREQFVPFFECIAEVVQHAHERGIVHGGLKPSNIMVIKGSDRLFPKLLGFGIDRLTRSDAGIDSPAYMAPEQRRSGDTVGRAADIYALGVIAYEALTGHVPIAAEP